MPTDGSARRSIATRCSAERPETSNSVCSPRTRWTRLSSWTRPSADCEPAWRATPVLHGSSRASSDVDHPVAVQLVDEAGLDLELGEAGPRRVRRQLVAVLVGLEADDARLQAQREVLRDDDDVVALQAQVLGDGEDAVVVVVGRHRRREAGGRLVVQLDAERAAPLVDRVRHRERPVGQPQALEMAQRMAGGPAQLGVVALRLQLHEHDDRDHHLVLVEAHERPRVSEQHRRVEHVGAGTRRIRSQRVVEHISPKRDGSHQVRSADDIRGGTAAWRVTVNHLIASPRPTGGPPANVHPPDTSGSQTGRGAVRSGVARSPRLVVGGSSTGRLAGGEGE